MFYSWIGERQAELAVFWAVWISGPPPSMIHADGVV